MKYYLAPLEGITGHLYRSSHHKFFQPFDKYFTPFLAPNQTRRFRSREVHDISPEHNKGMYVVPQILTNKSDDFQWAADHLHQLGYEEINLNLGCPSKTVVTKGKGSGFLARTAELDRFLSQIYTDSKVKISVKTRIGRDAPEEFYELLRIFNQYPITELIIHPRIQTAYYKNKPNYEMFERALELSKNPVVYNGDIFSVADFTELQQRFPNICTVMMGRGILRNPGLAGECKGIQRISKDLLKDFHDQLYLNYQYEMSGERNVLFKMKELWLYMINLFTSPEKYYKKIKKAERLHQYDEIIHNLFTEQTLM